MSSAKSVRLPDLWLKRAMAMRLLPSGTDASRIQNAWFARCMRGDTGTAAQFNQWLAGDANIRVTDDLPFLAGTLERLILDGNPAAINHDAIKGHLAGGYQPILLPGLLGTFGEFAAGLELLLQSRADYQEIGGADYVRQTLASTVRSELLNGMDEYAESASGIQILHGRTRDWVGSSKAGEKIIRQPAKDKYETIEKGDFVQFVIPPSRRNRFVFGFEMRMDDNLISCPWEDAGSWLGARLQFAGKATLLFDDPADDKDAAFADVEGMFSARVISVEAEQLGDFAGICDDGLSELKSKGLLDGCPDWPTGYAKAVALVTYVKRAAERAKRVRNRNALELQRSASFAGREAAVEEELPIPQLYQGSYRVVQA